jgi:hypothetical protein
MFRFRLKSATMAVNHQSGDPKGVAVMIPAGSQVVSRDAIEGRVGFDQSKLIEVKWAGRIVRIFLVDLVERGEHVDGARGY